MNHQNTAPSEPVTVSTGGWNGQTGPEVKHAIRPQATHRRAGDAQADYLHAARNAIREIEAAINRAQNRAENVATPDWKDAEAAARLAQDLRAISARNQ